MSKQMDRTISKHNCIRVNMEANTSKSRSEYIARVSHAKWGVGLLGCAASGVSTIKQ